MKYIPSSSVLMFPFPIFPSICHHFFPWWSPLSLGCDGISGLHFPDGGGCQNFFHMLNFTFWQLVFILLSYLVVKLFGTWGIFNSLYIADINPFSAIHPVKVFSHPVICLSSWLTIPFIVQIFFKFCVTPFCKIQFDFFRKSSSVCEGWVFACFPLTFNVSGVTLRSPVFFNFG